MNRLQTRVLPLLIGLLAAGCGGAPGYAGPITAAYLPYVEDVYVTGEPREGEPVMLHASLSAEMRPEVLQALSLWPNMAAPSGSWIPAWMQVNTEAKVVTLQPWISEPLKTGVNVNEYVFNLGLFKPGTYHLLIQTAESREWGGVQDSYNSGSPFQQAPTNPHAKYVEIEFTVLPAEEE
jgi:hypothetical protein